MPARDTSKADTTPDSGEPTTSTSATDASTTEGAKAAGVSQPALTPSSAGGAASAQQGAGDPVRVQIEQAPPEPEVQYPGDPNATDPNRPHVKADYQPFEW